MPDLSQLTKDHVVDIKVLSAPLTFYVDNISLSLLIELFLLQAICPFTKELQYSYLISLSW